MTNSTRLFGLKKGRYFDILLFDYTLIKSERILPAMKKEKGINSFDILLKQILKIYSTNKTKYIKLSFFYKEIQTFKYHPNRQTDVYFLKNFIFSIRYFL